MTSLPSPSEAGARRAAAWAEVLARGPWTVDDDVLLAAAEFAHERISRRLFALLSGRTGLPVIRDLIADLLPADEDRLVESALEMALWARARRSPEAARFMRAERADLFAVLRGLVADARAGGELPSLPLGAGPETVARRLIDVVDALSAHALLYPDGRAPIGAEELIRAELRRHGAR